MVCSTTLEDMEKSKEKQDSALNCLQQFKEELHSEACK